jgi:hypothetical protein
MAYVNYSEYKKKVKHKKTYCQSGRYKLHSKMRPGLDGFRLICP